LRYRLILTEADLSIITCMQAPDCVKLHAEQTTMLSANRKIKRLPAAVTFRWEEVHDEDLDRDVGKRRRISKTLTAWDGLIDERSLLSQRYSQDVRSKRDLSGPALDEEPEVKPMQRAPALIHCSANALQKNVLSITPRRATSHSGNRQVAYTTPTHVTSTTQVEGETNSHVSAHEPNLQHTLESSFDSRFLVLEAPDAPRAKKRPGLRGGPGPLDSQLKKGEDWCRTEEAKSIIRLIGNLMEYAKKTGNAERHDHEMQLVDKVIEYLDGIGRAMIEEGYSSPFRNTGSAPSDASKPDLAVVSALPAEREQPDIEACLIFWNFESSSHLGMNRDEVLVPLLRFTVRLHTLSQSLIASADGGPVSQQNLLGCKKMTGHLFGFSCCGHRMRLFHFDAFSFSSSKPADLDNEDDIPEIVKMVALCLSPVESIMPTWQPNEKHLAHMCPRMTDWTDVRPQWLDSRRDLCGRRTTVWAVTFPHVATVIKASWLSRDMLEHEYSVLQHLLKALAMVQDENADHEEVIACRFDLLGKISGWQDIFSRLPSPIGLKKGRELTEDFPGETNRIPSHPDGGQAEDLELAILVMAGPVASSTEGLSLIENIDVCIDHNQTLQVTSCLAVHLRDVNFGNLRALKAEGQTIRGVLIDFGGATIAGKHRKQAVSTAELIAYCKDDALSANPYFISTAALDNEEIAKRYEQACAALERYKGSDQTSPSELRLAQRDKDDAEREFKAIVRHRYIDDMESMIYYMVYNVRKLLQRFISDVLILYDLQGLDSIGQKAKAETLADRSTKTQAWKDGFKTVCLLVLAVFRYQSNASNLCKASSSDGP
jgi:hypothetical protein